MTTQMRSVIINWQLHGPLQTLTNF